MTLQNANKKKQSIAKRMPSFANKKGKGALNPPFRSKEDNSIMEGDNEQENA